jgi:hypothetical protein
MLGSCFSSGTLNVLIITENETKSSNKSYTVTSSSGTLVDQEDMMES